MENVIVPPREFARAILDDTRRTVANMPPELLARFAAMDFPQSVGFQSGLATILIAAAKERQHALTARL